MSETDPSCGLGEDISIWQSIGMIFCSRFICPRLGHVWRNVQNLMELRSPMQTLRRNRMSETKAQEERCPICDFPMAESFYHGCVPGNCSYRPHVGTPEYYRIEARKKALAEPAVAQPQPTKCGNEFKLRNGYFCELPLGHDGDHEATCPNPQFTQRWPNARPAEVEAQGARERLAEGEIEALVNKYSLATLTEFRVDRSRVNAELRLNLRALIREMDERAASEREARKKAEAECNHLKLELADRERIIAGIVKDNEGQVAASYVAGMGDGAKCREQLVKAEEARMKAELVIAARNIELRQAREFICELQKLAEDAFEGKTDVNETLDDIVQAAEAFLSPAAQEK